MTESPVSKHRRPGGRARFAPAAVVAGVAASAAIAMSMTGALGAFTAQILNNTNTTATGVLTMSETGPNSSGTATTCASTDNTTVSVNSATCSSINKYGGSTTFVPGSSSATTVTITNTGTVTANTFTLTPGVCAQSNNGAANGSATDLCSKINVVVVKSGVATPIVASTSLATYGGTVPAPATPLSLGTLAAGASATYTFTVSFPSTGSNATDDTYQGLKASQTLTWNFTS